MIVSSKLNRDILRFFERASRIKAGGGTKTLFDIAGYPHYENVISNILAFFFDADEEHGFDDLWTRSLIECYEIKLNNQQKISNYRNTEPIGREVMTEDNKRIDLLIPLEKQIIVIENKIYSGADGNPYASYHKKVSNDYPNKRIIAILLSLNEVRNKRVDDNVVFINITYKELFDVVERNCVLLEVDASGKWGILMRDLIENLRKLEGQGAMNREWQELIYQNREAFEMIIQNFYSDIANKVDFLKRVRAYIYGNRQDLVSGVYQSKVQRHDGYCSIYVDYQKDGDTMALEAYINTSYPCELLLTLWNRDKRSRETFAKERDILGDELISEESSKGWGRYLIIKRYYLGDDTISDYMVAMDILSLLERLEAGSNKC